MTKTELKAMLETLKNQGVISFDAEALEIAYTCGWQESDRRIRGVTSREEATFNLQQNLQQGSRRVP